jgi:hypothetical protein
MIGALDLWRERRRRSARRPLHRGARLNLPAAIAIERRLRKDLARQAHAGAHLDPVVRVAQVVEQNPRLVERVGEASRTQPRLFERIGPTCA